MITCGIIILYCTWIFIACTLVADAIYVLKHVSGVTPSCTHVHYMYVYRFLVEGILKNNRHVMYI